jgi:hypothetical protein
MQNTQQVRADASADVTDISVVLFRIVGFINMNCSPE